MRAVHRKRPGRPEGRHRENRRRPLSFIFGQDNHCYRSQNLKQRKIPLLHLPRRGGEKRGGRFGQTRIKMTKAILPLALEPGKKFSPSEAKAFTDEIKHRMYARWNERIFGGSFMRDLEAGKLPFETIRLFWKHWYSYPVEINNFHLIIY